MTRPDSNIPLSIDFALIALAMSILTPPTSDAAPLTANACVAAALLSARGTTLIIQSGKRCGAAIIRVCIYASVLLTFVTRQHSSNSLEAHCKRYDSANDAGIRLPPKCQLPAMKRASALCWRNTLYPQNKKFSAVRAVSKTRASGQRGGR